MDTQLMMLIFLLILVVAGMYQARRMKNFVFCTYTSRSKQTYDKLVKEQSSHVIFDGKKFNILPSCGKSRQYNKGLSSLFPTKITAYDYVWNSQNPIDPNTGQPAMLSPEVEKILDQEGALKDYAGSQQAGLTGRGRTGGLDKWMPYIMIGLVIAIVYSIYMSYQMKTDQDIMKQAISDIFTKIGY